MSKKNIKADDDVYFLGAKEGDEKKPDSKRIWIILACCLVAIVVTLALIFGLGKEEPDYYFEPEMTKLVAIETPSKLEPLRKDTIKGYIEVLEETVNDVPLFVYVPHQAEMSLSVGRPDKTDPQIVFITQAADIRGDNLEIVGDFVLKGQQLSRGVAKTGFCAIIDGKISIGVSDETPLLQKAIDKGGYFFRQYPLVDDGVLVENNPKNKSIRRALAMRSGKVVMVESRSSESFHDFAQALIDIGVSDAIYLVGSGITFGWYYDKGHNKTEFGVEQEELPENTSYIVWRSK
ncbi:hypothetical protein D0T84_06680 [Dysgonomonas sp. 521]|uniref:phosphodiester glycosidase family protein n=1 Tax=Dysgonomonas sp. 521 TaxID=2302932 RepID=UPI0013D7FC4E|nr:phosphodiester glycosidase family protein [Dysgonomonas sp. 521]NDV94607.1 hypothetical protein [Dysgonomonas sp. 521]